MHSDIYIVETVLLPLVNIREVIEVYRCTLLVIDMHLPVEATRLNDFHIIAFFVEERI